MSKSEKALNHFLKNKQIETLFQPIVSLRNGSILGYEALNQAISKQDFNRPEKMLAAAKEQNVLWDLELLCQTNALDVAQFHLHPPHNKKLFLNVEPEVVKDIDFQENSARDFLGKYSIPTENVIFELSEEAIAKDQESFKKAASHYKKHNFLLAIDDAGIGYSGLHLVADIKPNYLKVAMQLVRGMDKDRIKRSLVKAIVEFAKASNILLIAEGVETYEELAALTKLGVHCAQGYLIQKPAPEIKDLPVGAKQMIKRIHSTLTKIASQNVSHSMISELVEATKTAPQSMRIGEAYEVTQNEEWCNGFCITENGLPVGVLTKEKLTTTLSGRYGFTLNQKKTVDSIMDRDFLQVDAKMPINIVAHLAMERPQSKLYDFIVVTENNTYIGTVSIKNILQKAMEIEVSSARSLSPLTGLPGNNSIEARLLEMMNESLEYAVAYIDIDHFKAYNDVYGFEKGDQVIRLLANILKDTLGNDHFVGHIGGDDFLIISDSYLLKKELKPIAQRFKSEVMTYYNLQDKEKGYIISESRSGKERKYPLATITIAFITNEEANFETTHELTEALATLKKDIRQKKAAHQKLT